MNRRKRILSVATFALISCGLGLLLFLSHEPPEPIYNGKPLSYWVQGYDKLFSTNVTQSKADDAIRQMGTNAVPRLFRLLEARDSKLKSWAMALLQRQHWIRFSFKPAEDKNFEALSAFKALGPSASNVVPRLIETFDSNPDAYSQQAVPAILSYIGPPARQAVPALVRGTANTNWIVRFNCAVAIRKIEPDPKLVVRALIKLLGDPVSSVRREAAETLGRFGAGAKAAIPALLKLAADEPEQSAQWGFYIDSAIVLPPQNSQSALLSAKLQSINAPTYASVALQSIDPGAVARAGLK